MLHQTDNGRGKACADDKKRSGGHQQDNKGNQPREPDQLRRPGAQDSRRCDLQQIQRAAFERKRRIKQQLRCAGAVCQLNMAACVWQRFNCLCGQAGRRIRSKDRRPIGQQQTNSLLRICLELLHDGIQIVRRQIDIDLADICILRHAPKRAVQ